MRASQISSFGKERGDHSDSEPIWEVPEFWAGVKERRYRFYAHKAFLQNQVPRILILLKPDQLNVLLAKPVLPHLEFCPLSGFVCWALLVPLNREQEAWKDQLECSSWWLTLRLWLLSFVWSFIRNGFHSGDCHPSLSIWSGVTGRISTVPLGSVFCGELEYHAFIDHSGRGDIHDWGFCCFHN